MVPSVGPFGDDVAVVVVQLDDLAAGARLELGSRALGDDPAVVEHRDAVGEPIGLLQVLGGQEHRRAVVAEARMTSHSSRRLRVSSPVVGSSRNTHRRRDDQADRQVEAAAHPARVALGELAGSFGQTEAGQQIARARRTDSRRVSPDSRAIIRRFSAPESMPSTAAD